MVTPIRTSLFQLAKSTILPHVTPIMCSKVTLVHLSHTLEDIVLKNRIPAMMFTGFQESSHWTKETKRYAELATVAQQVCIFAGKPLPDDAAMGALQVELKANDPLRQEWFVIILSQQFSVILTGQDNLSTSPHIRESWRTFETILSFDGAVIERVLDQLERVVGDYRPEILAQLQAARQQYQPLETNPVFFNDIISQMVNFEEKLNQKIRHDSVINRQMIDTMQSFTLIIDRDGVISSVNPAFASAINQPAAQIIGENLLQSGIPESAHEQFSVALNLVLSTGAPRRLHTQLVVGDAIRDIDWDISLIYLQNHEESIFVMGHDVSERVLLEQARLEEAKIRAVLEQERELNNLRSQFITTVSHEFRTPLTSILNSAEMLEKHFGQLGEDGRKRRLKRIKDQVILLTGMVEEISLAMAASEGSLTFAPIYCRINEILDDILNAIRISLEDESRLRFTTAIENDNLIADPRLIRFIVSNLVTNALKYSPPNTTVDVTLSRKDNRLIFSIADYGGGIAEEDQKYIFDAFYRGNNVGAVSGTGMGLRIVRDCVAIYDGSIQFKSDNSGTTFTIRLPIPETLDAQTLSQ